MEARDVPAVAIQFDYSFDASGFFNDPARRAVLQLAADDLGSRLDTPLAVVTPSDGGAWAETFADPATGQPTTVPNPTLGADTLVVYVGGRPLAGTEAGAGSPGGYSAAGDLAWFDALRSRGPAGSLLWGGSIGFDTGTNWWFGAAPPAAGSGQVDFYSAATHELGHVLGIGTTDRWAALSAGGVFVGPAAESVYGGPVPLAPDGGHWAAGVAAGGQLASLDPALLTGTRVPVSLLDLAALRDLGWQVAATDPPTPPATPTPPAPRPAGQPVVLTGAPDGSAQVFNMTAGNTLAAAGGRVYPFPGFTGVIRSAVADFNGDGTPDEVFATGAGTAGAVRIIDGKTGADLLPPTQVLDGFSGGVFAAAGDLDGDDRAELAVSADSGGGPRITVYRVADGRLTAQADFIAFDLPDFRGGSRVGMGDIDGDGAADLVVGAGLGGGPRVAVYYGAGLAAGRVGHVVPDFFALDPALRSGVYVSVADLDGDGHADVLYSTGTTGGPRIRVVGGATLLANPGADVAALPAMADFFALDPDDRSGIRIVARDLDGDGRAEIVVGSGNRFSPAVRVLPPDQMNTPTTPLQNPFGDPLTIDGVYVG